MQGNFEEKGEGSLSESDQSSRERRVFGAFLVLGVLALVFGFLQILNGIRKPFDLGAASNTDETASGSTLAALRQKDVDNDGLNDYDELYTYQTSPYLSDSDSDGAADANEISAGTDPNCPVGKVCTPIGALGPATNTNVNGTAATTENTNAAPTSSALTISDLRETLRNAGAPAATLDAMSDDELKALYKEVTGQEFTQTTTNVNAAPVSAATNAATNSVTNSATNQATSESPSISSVDIAALRGLSVDQIKEFLINGGADPATLEGLDDATLQAVFQQALDELEKSNGL
ncbi:MAG: hypothetical protein HY566_00455 [Candidatus Kerfeldbacteria bacterium]|nr:hypothetical protein [Candidatus Kerfeldbacteria bacterium]